jgi:nucleoid DNA-binding protein
MSIIQKEIRDLIKELAEKHNLSFETVREIIYSQFKYVRQELESGVKGDYNSYKNVMLRYLGTFYTKENRLKHITEAKIRKNERLSKELRARE